MRWNYQNPSSVSYYLHLQLYEMTEFMDIISLDFVFYDFLGMFYFPPVIRYLLTYISWQTSFAFFLLILMFLLIFWSLTTFRLVLSFIHFVCVHFSLKMFCVYILYKFSYIFNDS